MGPLPASGGWVRLEVAARDVDLAGRTIDGMAFTLYDGTAAWDHAGVLGPRTACDSDGDGLSDIAEDLNGDGLYTPALGETSWTNYTSINGLNSGTGLQVFTPFKP